MKLCICMEEPKGNDNLEGYIRGRMYLFERLTSGKVKVWDGTHTSIMRPKVFTRYFLERTKPTCV